MLYFTVALRSRYSTSHWDCVLADFENTLRSICNQTCEDFAVYIGCNERPDISFDCVEKVHFVITQTPIPSSWIEGCRDRAWKQLACCAAIKQDLSSKGVLPSEGIYIFPVDADDYVSNRLAAYVKDHSSENGFKSPKSYKWNKGDKYMEITPYFGGSMNIMKLRPEEMPDEMPDISLCFDRSTCGELNEKYPIRWNDIEVEGKMAAIGRPLAKLPFYSTIYVLNTGVNISGSDPANQNAANHRIHFRTLLRRLNFSLWKRLDNKVKHEFGMIIKF